MMIYQKEAFGLPFSLGVVSSLLKWSLCLCKGVKMKVMLVNGSPHKNGTTNRALDEVAKTLEAENIECGRFWVGSSAIAGCVGCGHCAKNGGECVFDDIVNEFNHQAADYDGYIFGTSVHYAAATGSITSFMDRSFYSQACGGVNFYPHKPAAAVACARRAGCANAFDQLNKYFSIVQMPIVSATYWNMVFGANADDAELDKEGMRTMRVLAHNMAYMLRCQEAGRAAGIQPPELEPPARTNFIR